MSDIYAELNRGLEEAARWADGEYCYQRKGDAERCFSLDAFTAYMVKAERGEPGIEKGARAVIALSQWHKATEETRRICKGLFDGVRV